jgi:integrase/recombinase XerD
LRLQEQASHPPSDLEITDLDAPAVLAFLEHLETTRENTPRSPNVRLSSIRSFCRFVSVRDVEHLAVVNRVLAIPNKRAGRPLMTF